MNDRLTVCSYINFLDYIHRFNSRVYVVVLINIVYRNRQRRLRQQMAKPDTDNQPDVKMSLTVV